MAGGRVSCTQILQLQSWYSSSDCVIVGPRTLSELALLLTTAHHVNIFELMAVLK